MSRNLIAGWLSRAVRYPWRVVTFPFRVSRRLSKLEQDYQALRRDHAAAVAWLHEVCPEIVSAVGSKLDKNSLDLLSQHLFEALHREIGKLGRQESHPVMHVDPDGSGSDTGLNLPDADMETFYLALERRFRGTREEIADRVRPYLSLLGATTENRGMVLDLGCGRGEWLEVLEQAGFDARGVDLNPVNGDFCRALGLDVITVDVLRYLSALPDGTLSVVTAFHLVEHMPFSRLLVLTGEIFRVLKPGGLLIYETPNPENLEVATYSFWMDPTHLRPLPPELLEFLVLQGGFADVEVRRLHPLEAVDTGNEPLLRSLLSGPRDYAVIAHKPLSPG